MKNSKRGFVPILLVIIAVLAVGVVYLFYTQMSYRNREGEIKQLEITVNQSDTSISKEQVNKILGQGKVDVSSGGSDEKNLIINKCGEDYEQYYYRGNVSFFSGKWEDTIIVYFSHDEACYFKRYGLGPKMPNTEIQTNIQSTTTVQTAGLKKYSDSALEFEYSPLLSVKNENGAVSLGHYIAYKHPNACDFKGDAPPLNNLTDFNVSFTISNESLESAKKSNFVWSYDKFNVGSLSGFKGESGIEGCGQYLYIFPISETKTLVVKRYYITEFKPIIADYQKYLNLPGIITPNQETEIFTKILSSLKVK